MHALQVCRAGCMVGNVVGCGACFVIVTSKGYWVCTICIQQSAEIPIAPQVNLTMNATGWSHLISTGDVPFGINVHVHIESNSKTMQESKIPME